MPISRRDWLKSGLITGAVVGLPFFQRASGATARLAPAQRDAEGETLTRSRLLQETGTRFVVWRGAGRPVGLRLVSVADPASAAAAGTLGSEDCFSAFFEGVAYAPIAQGTYRVTHATLGTLTLFLVPVGRPAKVRTYELAVNRRTA